MLINLIYSETLDHVIGVNNDLYCRISEDLKHFYEITTSVPKDKKNVLLMGYNTYKSIPKDLRNNKRHIVVVSRNHKEELEKEGIENYNDIGVCIERVEQNDIYDKLFVIGGSKIFQEIITKYFHKIDLIYQTKILEEVEYGITNTIISPILILDHIFKNERCLSLK